MIDGIDAVATDSVVNSQEATTSSVVESPKVENNDSIAITQDKKPDKLFTRDEVAKITNAERQKAIEKAKREWETSSALANSNIQGTYNPQNVQTTPQVDVQQAMSQEQLDHVYQQMQQKAALDEQKKAQERFFHQNISEFGGKMTEAEARYPDYKDVINTLGLDKMPEQALASMVSLLNVAENGGDVLYDLAKNPTKYAGVINLVGLNPNLAIAEIKRLSHSIKQNEIAAKAPIANAPLSQINPSTTGTDNGVMTLKDMKRQPWARG